MNKETFYILNNLYNRSVGRSYVLKDLFFDRAMIDSDSISKLIDFGYVDKQTGQITKSGIALLEPYRVNNAVILAAGAATRFIPLSLEQPKGLYEVKGEKLIERQIKQLQEAGIKNITVVLGYKKEMFYYLQDKYGVKLVINDEYNTKNNIQSLWCAKSELKNTYVCSCDDYFVDNPFQQFEYEAFYAGVEVDSNTNEMYAMVDQNKKIIAMQKGLESGKIVLGHSFWSKDFCNAFLSLVEADLEVGKYSQSFWEWIVSDNLQALPSYYFKEYSKNSIYEFDYFEELRAFDTDYVIHSNSEIIRNIKLVFRCDEEDIVDFRNVNEGMTNTSFIFKIDGVDYIYRHPGDGTESIINRRNEKKSLVKAKKAGIDPTYIYMDVNEGWKISQFIHNFREPDYTSFEDSKKILSVLRKLHSTDIKADYGMKPWDDAVDMENILKKKSVGCFEPYEALKLKIKKLYVKTINDGVKKCFCHGDTYKPNWMLKEDGGVILIDWEYSGYSDPGIDVGYYIVDAMYDFDTAKKFIAEYLQEDNTPEKEFHFMAYTAIIAYYWFVWALYRESCGAVMGEALTNWHDMAEKYVDYLLEQ